MATPRTATFPFSAQCNLGRQSDECSLYLGATAKWRRFQGAAFSDLGVQFQSCDVKVGDRLRLRFHFKKSRCSVFWNGRFVAVLTDELPQRVCPAISVAFEHTFETTQWRIVDAAELESEQQSVADDDEKMLQLRVDANDNDRPSLRSFSSSAPLIPRRREKVTPIAFPDFEWDPHRKSSRISLSADRRTASLSDRLVGAWRCFVAKPLLKASALRGVEWEVTLRRIPDNPSQLHFMMGFVASAALSTLDYNSDLGDDAQHCCLYLNGLRGFQKYTAASEWAYVDAERWKSDNVSVGDTFEFGMDFEAETATVFYNGECVGVLTDALPSELYVAMAAAYEHSFETTKWNLIAKE